MKRSSLPFITAGEAGPLHLEMTLTRAKFDDLTRDLVERTKVPVRQALSDAGLSLLPQFVLGEDLFV